MYVAQGDIPVLLRWPVVQVEITGTRARFAVDLSNPGNSHHLVTLQRSIDLTTTASE
ncbi:hypothetical protein SACE_5076 [Saccharopolyspora erythraea NRRL 2338]|uniref:Uncharacterized protein n=1 Tax=Saccharopolyspora erythraea (strain ATCC 11635 / DSM 40517 / JCM 4748 / NBRC 13426 / NCIMB 8594 / NRRL 2338) TaxID=405948 RepID=A4FJW0_SACEN|nr:hypothetical protein SACE_5076 [Saccharopolyspora erythraea NRRL 2338]